MEEQIKRTLEKLRSMLQADGGDLELVEIAGKDVKLRLKGACGTCPHAAMTLKEAFQTAVNWEQESHELYLNLAQIHPPGPVKNLLEELASQELEHRQRVESLYRQVDRTGNEGGG